MEMQRVHRDISWLYFNERVLMEAEKPGVPLMERFRFMAIYSSNLDEFYRVRMPSLRSSYPANDADGVPVEGGPAVLEQVNNMVNQQLNRYGANLRNSLLPAAKAMGTFLYYDEALPTWLREASAIFFFEKLLPYLQPALLRGDAAPFFPRNNQLYHLVQLQDENKALHLAMLNIPSAQVGRFFVHKGADSITHVFFIDDVIRVHLPFIFKDFRVIEAYSIKVNRDADLHIADEKIPNLDLLIEQKVKSRDAGAATRLLHDPAIPAPHVQFLRLLWQLPESSVVKGGRYHNLRDLSAIPDAQLKTASYPDFRPVIPAVFEAPASLFDTIQQRDIGLHFPYHSYFPVLRFFSEAAVDPSVEQIAVTLYRIADDSRIANALISAALNGKKVRVFVELKARFDEDNNLRWSRKMKDAGVSILYSIPDWKVHAKVALVRRRKNGTTAYTALLATGNFNEQTARFYTDHALFTASKSLTRELDLLFTGLLTKLAPPDWPVRPFRHLLVAPFNLMSHFLDLMAFEVEMAKAGKKASIILKMNNLEEPEMIKALYDASQAGVSIQLIVRGICRLSPGVPGLSEHISVRRIVDRFLEHGRIYYFHHGGEEVYIAGSADWMTRNLRRRIEVCYPVTDPVIRSDLWHQLELMLADTYSAVTLGPQGENLPVRNNEASIAVQQELIRYFQTP